ncbi:MAG: toll/interleukin-1 receptor domain-containing protein [Spirochaetales bacterium]|nr:toll/interleukin-1 receptor domain-containing protein [Spirochaetales bacterium]
MISVISVTLKQFLIDRFANESAFDDLCREIGISYSSSEDFATRMTGLLRKAASNHPDYIGKLYTACIKLRPGFTEEINILFEVTPSSKTPNNLETADIRIFLSYSWKNKAVADELDKAFQSRGIQLVRDIYDVQYKYDLKEFMKSIRDCDYAITIISDAYLKSPNCMFEIMELLKERKFRDKILPIYQDDAKIFTPAGRVAYITYWNAEYDELKTSAQGLDLAQAGEVAEDLKMLEIIRMEIAGFMGAVSRMRLIPYDELRAGGYKEIFDEVL